MTTRNVACWLYTLISTSFYMKNPLDCIPPTIFSKRTLKSGLSPGISEDPRNSWLTHQQRNRLSRLDRRHSRLTHVFLVLCFVIKQTENVIRRLFESSCKAGRVSNLKVFERCAGLYHEEQNNKSKYNTGEELGPITRNVKEIEKVTTIFEAITELSAT